MSPTKSDIRGLPGGRFSAPPAVKGLNNMGAQHAVGVYHRSCDMPQ